MVIVFVLLSQFFFPHFLLSAAVKPGPRSGLMSGWLIRCEVPRLGLGLVQQVEDEPSSHTPPKASPPTHTKHQTHSEPPPPSLPPPFHCLLSVSVKNKVIRAASKRKTYHLLAVG